jgi:hypothetical protein
MAGSLRVSPRSLIVGCGVMLAFLIAAPAASATCDGEILEQPFAQWSDSAYYVLLSDGDVTDGGAGWDLDGAEVVEDNEPWYVHGGDTPAAVRIGDGAVATTPPICVTPDHPTMRFFVRNAGSEDGALLVEVVSDEHLVLPIGVVSGTDQDAEWAPSPILQILANEFDDEVAFRFTATGSAESAWVIDDVYVDPYKKGF